MGIINLDFKQSSGHAKQQYFWYWQTEEEERVSVTLWMCITVLAIPEYPAHYLADRDTYSPLTLLSEVISRHNFGGKKFDCIQGTLCSCTHIYVAHYTPSTLVHFSLR